MASYKILFVSLANVLLMSSFVLFATSVRLNLSEDNRHYSSEDLISKTCSHTLYYEICLSSLKSDPGSETAEDVQALANVALNISIAYGEATLAHITDLKSKSAGNDSLMIAACLRDCVEEYNDAVEDLKDAVDALTKTKSLQDVKDLVSSAMTDSDTCEDGFKEMEVGGNDGSPFADRSLYFSKLCSNFLAISNLL